MSDTDKPLDNSGDGELCSRCDHPKKDHTPSYGCALCSCTKAGYRASDYLVDDPRSRSGHGFAPGNPGRPRASRGPASIRRIMKKIALEQEGRIEKLIVDLLFNGEESVQQQVLKLINEQLDGRASQSIRLTGANDGPVTTYDLTKIPPEKLREMLATLKGALKEAE